MLLSPHPDTQKLWEANKGTLEVTETGVEFRSKRPVSIPHPLAVERVHNAAWANDLMRVDYAEGDVVNSVFIIVPKRGRAGREIIDRVEEALKAVVVPGQAEAVAAGAGEGATAGDAAPGRSESEELELHRQAMAEQEAARRRTTMISGVVMVVVGIAVALFTRELLGWAIVLLGIAQLIRAFMSRTTAAKGPDRR